MIKRENIFIISLFVCALKKYGVAVEKYPRYFLKVYSDWELDSFQARKRKGLL